MSIPRHRPSVAALRVEYLLLLFPMSTTLIYESWMLMTIVMGEGRRHVSVLHLQESDPWRFCTLVSTIVPMDCFNGKLDFERKTGHLTENLGDVQYLQYLGFNRQFPISINSLRSNLSCSHNICNFPLGWFALLNSGSNVAKRIPSICFRRHCLFIFFYLRFRI